MDMTSSSKGRPSLTCLSWSLQRQRNWCQKKMQVFTETLARDLGISCRVFLSWCLQSRNTRVVSASWRLDTKSVSKESLSAPSQRQPSLGDVLATVLRRLQWQRLSGVPNCKTIKLGDGHRVRTEFAVSTHVRLAYHRAKHISTALSGARAGCWVRTDNLLADFGRWFSLRISSIRQSRNKDKSKKEVVCFGCDESGHLKKHSKDRRLRAGGSNTRGSEKGMADILVGDSGVQASLIISPKLVVIGTGTNSTGKTLRPFFHNEDFRMLRRHQNRSGPPSRMLWMRTGQRSSRLRILWWRPTLRSPAWT